MKSNADVFEWVCGELERMTDLSRLEARGTIRIALKEAGLETHHVSVDEMAVVIKNVLPTELTNRGIDASTLVVRLDSGVRAIGDDRHRTASAAEVFRHLGGE